MKPHKWAKEIKAWADGAEIEYRRKNGYGSLASEWVTITQEESDGINWGIDDWEFRIKPQQQQSSCCQCQQTSSALKEPQYLYVYADEGGINLSQYMTMFNNGTPYIGKIKLETDDE